MIRFADNDRDEKLIHSILLNDSLGREKLNIRGYDKLIENDRWCVTFIDEEKGELKGFIKLSANTLDGCFCINDLFVSEKHRRKGIGKKLLLYAEKYGFETWPAKYVYAFTIQNKVMEGLLKKHEYKDHGTYKKFIYRNGKYLSQTLFLKRKKI